MKGIPAFLVMVTVLAVSNAGMAQPAGQDRDRRVANADIAVSADNAGIVGEACFGDRYESDADMNEGNTITEEEILRILNPPRS